MLIAHSVAHRRKLQRRHGIEETGGQAAEPTIAEARVRLLVQDLDHSRPRSANARSTKGSSMKFMTLLASERPIRNSIEI